LVFSYLDMVGVGGSNPLGRTRYKNTSHRLVFLYLDQTGREPPKVVRQNCREQFWTPKGRARRAEYQDDTSTNRQDSRFAQLRCPKGERHGWRE
jgi:hypothetical protein